MAMRPPARSVRDRAIALLALGATIAMLLIIAMPALSHLRATVIASIASESERLDIAIATVPDVLIGDRSAIHIRTDSAARHALPGETLQLCRTHGSAHESTTGV
jgi:hypothetical protein